jgi:hypothetical protein
MLCAVCAALGEPMEELRLSDEDAHRLAARIVDVEKHYKLPAIPSDKLALGMLAVTAFRVYAPKAGAIWARKNTPPEAPPVQGPVVFNETVRSVADVAPDRLVSTADWFAAPDGTVLQ